MPLLKWGSLALACLGAGFFLGLGVALSHVAALGGFAGGGATEGGGLPGVLLGLGLLLLLALPFVHVLSLCWYQWRRRPVPGALTALSWLAMIFVALAVLFAGTHGIVRGGPALRFEIPALFYCLGVAGFMILRRPPPAA